MTATSWIPKLMAFFMASSAATLAAKGVLFREPLKPVEPALAAVNALP
jgi:hypothetical protein